MKKWQEWTIAVIAIIVVVGAIGGAYWYLTNGSEKSDNTIVPLTQSQEQKDLAEVEADLNGVEDLDLSALDNIEKDLQAIDLSSL